MAENRAILYAFAVIPQILPQILHLPEPVGMDRL